MPDIILRDVIVADDWQVLRPSPGEPAAVPAGRVIVPLAVWLDQQTQLATRGNVGVWLAGNDDPAQLSESLALLSLVAVDFPKFTDGRGYSLAYLLRSRFGYRAAACHRRRVTGPVVLYETCRIRRLCRAC